MGLAARARYEKLFTPDIVLPMMLNTYDRVARLKAGATAGLAAASAATGGPAFHLHPWMQAEHAK
jgi:hypothetical protein